MPVKDKDNNNNKLVFSLWLVAILLLLWPAFQLSLSDNTIVPADNLYLHAPYQADAQTLRISKPHNPLYSDLVLQNYPWWQFIHKSLKDGELPLWNPYIFSGTPFLAKGQHLALYPLSFPFHLMPIEQAYGLFLVIHLFIAGCTAFLLARSLGISRYGALISGLTYGISGFMLARAVFPMIIASSAWLPLVLAMAERVISPIQSQSHRRNFIWVLIGALAIGFQALAGHPEILIYTLLVLAFYCSWRCISLRDKKRENRNRPNIFYTFSMLAVMVFTGLALGAVQLLPQYLILQENFRSVTADFSQITSWAYPWQQAITLLVPNFFGNPAQYNYTDFFSGVTHQLDQPIYWGVKNFVEGAFYVGILPLILAFIGIWHRQPITPNKTKTKRPPSPAIFGCMLVLSLCFVFGSLFYYAIYILPGMEQIHSPFRWVLVSTLSIAILAGYGIDMLSKASRLASYLSSFILASGCVILAFMLFTRLFVEAVKPLWAALLRISGGNHSAITGTEQFISFEAPWFIHLSFMLIFSGLVLGLALNSHKAENKSPLLSLWKPLLFTIIVIDLLLFAKGLYPNVDPALLHHKPSIITQMKNDDTHWRFTTYDPQSKKIFMANMGWLHNFQDIRGYDSIFSATYRNYMEIIDQQDELLYNRIAPLRSKISLDSPLLDLLNVKYILSESTIDNPRYSLTNQGQGLLLYRNNGALPRAFTLPLTSTVIAKDPFTAMREFDPRFHLILPDKNINTASFTQITDYLPQPGKPQAAEIIRYRNNEVLISVTTKEPLWLVLSDSYAQGWHASKWPDGDPTQVSPLQIKQAYGTLRAVELDEGKWEVRFRYLPYNLIVGACLTLLVGSFIVFCLLFSLSKEWSFFTKKQDPGPDIS